MQSIYTTTQKQNVIDLINRGDLSYRQIAEETGTNTKYVQNIKARYVRLKKSATTDARKFGCRNKIINHDAVIALYKAGFDMPSIAATLNVSIGTISIDVARFRLANPDFETPKVLARLERDKRICELRESGNTYAKIGEQVGLSEHGVYAVCSKYGITAPAKRARKDNGEIPQEILAPLVEYMRKFISAEFAEKVQELAKNIA